MNRGYRSSKFGPLKDIEIASLIPSQKIRVRKRNLRSAPCELEPPYLVLDIKTGLTEKDLFFRKIDDFDDVEKFFKLHRFGWLLTELNNKNLEQFENIIHFWVQSAAHGNYANDSYSISERTLNWLTFFKYRGVSVPIEIKKSITQQLARLAANLEDRGLATNNHLLNNGRALYIAGHSLGVSSSANLGRLILMRCIPKMISDKGFLREGSVHYHFLVTRSLIEISLQADEAQDYEMIRSCISPTSAALRWIEQLYKGGDIVTFGDNSPDFPIEFHNFIENPETLSANHNANSGTLWTDFFDLGKFRAIQTRYKDSGQVLSGSARGIDFIRRDTGLYEIFVTGQAGSLALPAWSHAGSLFGHVGCRFQRKCLLQSDSRVNYLPNRESLSLRSIYCSNMLQIEGLEPQIINGVNFFGEFLPDEYEKAYTGIEFERNHDGWQEFTYIDRRYGRFAPYLSTVRKVRANRVSLIIEDSAEGWSNGPSLRAETRFWFDEFWSVVDQNISSDAVQLILSGNNTFVRIKAFGANEYQVRTRSYSNSYGETKTGAMIYVANYFPKQIMNSFVIEFDK